MSDSPNRHSSSHLVDQAALSAEEALASTRRLANEAINGLAESVEELRSAVGPAIDQVAGQAGHMAQSGADALRAGSHRLADRAQQAGDDTVRFIRKQPVASVLMAAAAGATLMALLGLLTHRRGQG
jgi:ElaB/YqjD/DUF883 family membrane-anchored ribosome-binding protein